MEPEPTSNSAAGCLSQAHIRAQGSQPGAPVETIPAQLVVYTDASFGKVTRELERRQCVTCGEPFEVLVASHEKHCFMCRTVKRTCSQCGQEFRVTNEVFRTQEYFGCPICGGFNEGCKRGEVTRFSEDSKRRLMQLLNKVQRDVSLVCFVTLTFPDEYFPLNSEPEDWKERLRLFEWRFRRAFPAGAFVWRVEVEDRKSGEHVGEFFPHFHLLTFGVPLTELRPWVAENWYEIAGCGNPEHYRVHRHERAVTPVFSRRGVMSYASKAVGSVMSRELSKALQAKGENVGRWWGVAVRKVFETFLALPETFELNDEDAISILRTFRKYVRASVLEKWRSAGKRWRKPKNHSFQHRSLNVFLHGGWLRRNILNLVSSPGAWCYGATGRRYDVPFWQHAGVQLVAA